MGQLKNAHQKKEKEKEKEKKKNKFGGWSA